MYLIVKLSRQDKLWFFFQIVNSAWHGAVMVRMLYSQWRGHRLDSKHFSTFVSKDTVLTASLFPGERDLFRRSPVPSEPRWTHIYCPAFSSRSCPVPHNAGKRQKFRPIHFSTPAASSQTPSGTAGGKPTAVNCSPSSGTPSSQTSRPYAETPSLAWELSGSRWLNTSTRCNNYYM